MARKKVKLVRILNENARKACLKKRRLGFMKKMEELTILCDVEAFLIIYSPSETEPLLWPNHDAVQRLFTKYLNIPGIERSKKLLNQEYYLKEKVGKMQHQLLKCLKMIKEMEATHLLNQIYLEGKKIGELNTSGFDSLNSFLEEKRKHVQRFKHFHQMSLDQQALKPAIPSTSTEQQMAEIENSDAIPWNRLIMEMMNPNGNILENNTINDAGLFDINHGNNTISAPSINSLSIQDLTGNQVDNFSLSPRGGHVEHDPRLPQGYFQSTDSGLNQFRQGNCSSRGNESHNMWQQHENAGEFEIGHDMILPNVSIENNNERHNFSLPQGNLLNNSIGTSLTGPNNSHMSSCIDGNGIELPPFPSQLRFPINWPNNSPYP